jgi:hypothetical protein
MRLIFISMDENDLHRGMPARPRKEGGMEEGREASAAPEARLFCPVLMEGPLMGGISRLRPETTAQFRVAGSHSHTRSCGVTPTCQALGFS